MCAGSPEWARAAPLRGPWWWVEYNHAARPTGSEASPSLPVLALVVLRCRLSNASVAKANAKAAAAVVGVVVVLVVVVVS